MNEELKETGIPHPSEVAKVLRELAPRLCKKIDTLTAFQGYIQDEKNLKEIKVHPRHEMLARLWCAPLPERRHIPNFILYIDHNMPEYEMHLIYKNGKCETIKLH